MTLLLLVLPAAVSAEAVCADGAELAAAERPDGYDDYLDRFDAAFDADGEHDFGGDSEIAAARRQRNQLRAAAPRLLAEEEHFGAGVVLSSRFCGLTYTNSSRDHDVDCVPADAAAASAPTFLAACYDAPPRSPCSLGDLGPGAVDMPKYIVSVGPTLAGAAALAAALVGLLLFWFGLRRYCGCFGGRTPSAKCQCPCLGKHFAGYGRRQVAIFRGCAALLAGLLLVAGVLGMIGSVRVSGGLSGATEALSYDLHQLVERFDSALAAISAATGSPVSPTLTAEAARFRCAVAEMQGTLDDAGGGILTARSWIGGALAVLPSLLGCLGCWAGWTNRPGVVGGVGAALVPFLALSCVSVGLHAVVAIILGDLCLELDLTLSFPAGAAISLPWQPEDAPVLPCGAEETPGAGSLQKLEDDVLRTMGPLVEQVAEMIKDACNGQGDFEAFSRANMNCSAAAGEDGLLRGRPGLYMDGWYNAENVEAAIVGITLGDIAVAQIETRPQCSTAAANPEDQDGRCGLDGSAVFNCRPSTEWLNAAARGATAAQAALETRITLESCAKLGGGGCMRPQYQSLACQIVDSDELRKMRVLSELLEGTLRPLARCEFAADVLPPVYVGLCVDALSGLSIMSVAGGLGAIIMLLAVPFAAAAQKRFTAVNQVGVVRKVHPGDTAGDSPRLRIDNHLLDFSAEGGALVVRPPEGERTFLLGGPSMQGGRHFAEFTPVRSNRGSDWIVGLARPNFKPSATGGEISVTATKKKGKGVGWGLRTHSGALAHAGRGFAWEGQRQMPRGSRIGLLLDLAEGEADLTVYLEGVKLGEAIAEGELEGPLVWMAELLHEGDAIRIERKTAPVGPIPDRLVGRGFEHYEHA